MEGQIQTPQEPTNDSGSVFWKTFGITVLVLVGVGIVFAVGLFLGRFIARGVADPPDPSDPTVSAPTPAPEVPYVVANSAVNVRSGPSTEYPIYGVLSPGQSAEVSGVSLDGNWWTLKIPTSIASDGLGWVSAAYVTAYNTQNVPVIEPPPLPPDIKPPPPETGSPYIVTVEPVNVRSGPGNEFPSYGKVPRGTTLAAIGVSGDGKWVAVVIPTSVAPDGIGWVNASYVERLEAVNLPLMQP